MHEEYSHIPTTDLAYERERSDIELEGVSFYSEQIGELEIERLTVSNDAGARSIGKDKGRYTSLCFERIWKLDEAKLEELSMALSSAMLEFCALPDNETVLVVGLGNRNITADAIGPKTVEKIIATRHLRLHTPEIFKENFKRSIAAIAPGVLGQTGIEAAEIVRGAAKACDAKLILAIDALASRSPTRLASTIQLCDSGIVPGSGIGNSRAAINKSTIGIPVVAIGVPTVISSATLIRDAISGSEKSPRNIEVISEQIENLYVSPRESDTVTEIFSTLIADAINTSFGVFSK